MAKTNTMTKQAINTHTDTLSAQQNSKIFL